MNRLSACLITYNEEHNLPRVLNSIQGIAEEIVVVDCGSNDHTLDIAREYGAKVLTHPWSNFGAQKNRAAAAASNDWILWLDAEEGMCAELGAALLRWKWQETGLAEY